MSVNIQKLKNNLAWLMNMPDKERRFLKKVGWKNCEMLLPDGKWVELKDKYDFTPRRVFRLKHNYPEYKDYEICTYCNQWGIWIGSRFLTPIAIMSRPDFEGIYLFDDDCRIPVDSVASYMRRNKKLVVKLLDNQKG